MEAALDQMQNQLCGNGRGRGAFIRGPYRLPVAIDGVDDTLCGLGDGLERSGQHLRSHVVAGKIEAAFGVDSIVGKHRKADGLHLQFALLVRHLLAVLFVEEFVSQFVDDDSAARGGG